MDYELVYALQHRLELLEAAVSSLQHALQAALDQIEHLQKGTKT